MSGYIDTGSAPPSEPLDALAIIADELGLNFDLRALWDIIPLSFVADYFVPIGDTLESIHPRGWFCPKFLFTGHVSVKLKISALAAPGSRSFRDDTYTVFNRRVLTTTIASRKTVSPDFKVPKLKKFADVAYLAAKPKIGNRRL